VTIAAPHLAELVALTRESVFLSERIGDDVICVASAESPRPLSFYMRLGQRTPYHAAASARAILAFRPSSERLRLLEAEDLEMFTARTPSSVTAVMRALEATRSSGYAVCDEELEVGVTAVSVPVASATGDIDASLTLVAPQDRRCGSSRLDAAERLARAGRSISADLGHRRFASSVGPIELESSDPSHDEATVLELAASERQ
jgi:IclR family acetate operon transcriptional repressor